MGQFSKVLLAINNTHTVLQSSGLWTRVRWVKPGLWAQPSNSLCLKYIKSEIMIIENNWSSMPEVCHSQAVDWLT